MKQTFLIRGLVPAKLCAGLVEPLPVANITGYSRHRICVVTGLEHGNFAVIVHIQALGTCHLQAQVIHLFR